MKKCPFCAEEIQEEAMKCRFCGEFLTAQKSKSPWYEKTSVLILLFLTVGPLMLPLVWFHPQYSRNKKIVATVIILLLTALLVWASMASLQSLKHYYQEIADLLKIL